MLVYVLCLMFGAHPDFWLREDDFDKAHPEIARRVKVLEIARQEIEAIYKSLAEKQAEMPIDTRAAQQVIARLIERIETDLLPDMDRARVRYRTLALTHPLDYQNRK